MTFCNASLHTLFMGHRPARRHLHRGREYFQFENRQIRRQIGQGHCSAERAARREARHIRRANLHRDPPPDLSHIAALLIAKAYQSAPSA